MTAKGCVAVCGNGATHDRPASLRSRTPESQSGDVFALAALLNLPRPVHIGSGLWACEGEITPDLAEVILVHYHIQTNRNKKPAPISRYAHDMERGHWRFGHQGLAFNEDGVLFDGQNRLHACVQSGCSFRTPVFFNVDRNFMPNADGGVKRSGRDAAKIMGRDVSDREVAAVKRMAAGSRVVHYTNEQTLQLLELFREPAQLIAEAFPLHIKRITTSPVLAAVGRASYHADRGRLMEFCLCLRENCVADRNADGAAVSALRFLNDGATGKTSSTHQIDAYLKVSNAIRAFLECRSLTKLYASNDAEFPLPADIKSAVESL
jgi:hypothetical protein